MEVFCHSCKIPVQSLTSLEKTSIFCNNCLSQHKSALSHLDRTPIKCPVTKCSKEMCMTNILSHFINEECIPVDFVSVKENFEIELCLNFDTLPSDGCYCIGGLLLEQTSLSLPNSIHNIQFKKFRNYLPILIMAARSDLKTLLMRRSDRNDTKNEILALWLVSPQTSEPVYGEILACRKKFGKGMEICVRDVREETPLEDFLHENLNYLFLTKGEMSNLRDLEGKILLKIKIFVANKTNN